MKVQFMNAQKIKEEKFPYGNYYKFNFSPLLASSIEDNNIYYSIRYSELFDFHSDLLKLYKKNYLPHFPEKIFFFQENYVLKRAKDLENYINKILSMNNDKIKREMKFLLNSHINLKNASLSESSINTSFSTICSLSDNNENRIDNFLKNLSIAKNDFSIVIDDFVKENNIFKATNIFNKEEIYKLFFGETNKLNGLLYYFNTYVNINLFSTISCLFFVSKLIDCECNNDFKIYRKVFKLITSHTLKNLNLEKFLELNNSNIIDRVFVIIRCICENNNYQFNDCFNGNLYKKYYNQYVEWLDD